MRTPILALLLLMSLVPLQPAAAAGEAEKSKAEPRTAPPYLTPITADELANVRAGEAPIVEVITDQNLKASVTGNRITAGTVLSGDVNIGANALGFNGIGNFVINTGNNNVLQGSLSVTVLSTTGN